MRSTARAAILATIASIAAAGQSEQIPLNSLFPQEWQAHLSFEPEASLSTCKISQTTAFQQHDGPVDFSESTTEHLETPKLSSINATAWEQWEFDGTAESGMSGIIMGFSRDPSYPFFGQGNLRVEFYMALEDGTVIQELDHLKQSTIITCDGSVTGVWNSTGRTYGFQVPTDMSRAKVWWATPRSKGSLTMFSDTLPHLADGKLWPAEAGTVEMSPSLYLNQPIAGGRVVVDHTLGKQRLQFTGRGGHGRVWAKDSWFKVCDGWNIIRGFAGPYSLALWRPVSRINKGMPYYSAQLFKDGELLVGTAKGDPSATEDYVLLTNDFSGNVSGSLADRSTGQVVHFVSPSQGKTWRFELQHKRRKFNMGLGGGLGLSGFTGSVTGGEVGEEDFRGMGFAEQAALPMEVKQWQIWIVYGIGLLGEWRNFFFNLATSILG
ncbi:hypothetical protein CCHR01_19597 [Colletotrichum chrysophilum]|uniref:AttH domain-containing protein n=1 Tax=Colletotrichum chrysophilum TaxID=1836956 RepID=A0AAD9E7Q6_9PEZI|nr:hypothetical protein CCHR01_19597 [Colletotrichum chrysophilum]